MYALFRRDAEAAVATLDDIYGHRFIALRVLTPGTDGLNVKWMPGEWNIEDIDAFAEDASVP